MGTVAASRRANRARSSGRGDQRFGGRARRKQRGAGRRRPTSSCRCRRLGGAAPSLSGTRPRPARHRVRTRGQWSDRQTRPDRGFAFRRSGPRLRTCLWREGSELSRDAVALEPTQRSHCGPTVRQRNCMRDATRSRVASTEMGERAEITLGTRHRAKTQLNGNRAVTGLENRFPPAPLLHPGGRETLQCTSTASNLPAGGLVQWWLTGSPKHCADAR